MALRRSKSIRHKNDIMGTTITMDHHRRGVVVPLFIYRYVILHLPSRKGTQEQDQQRVSRLMRGKEQTGPRTALGFFVCCGSRCQW